MKTRSLRRLRIVGILMLGALAIGLWQFLLAPRFTEPGRIAAQTEAALAQKTTLDEELAVLVNRAAALDEAEEEADALSALLPPTAETPQLTTYINEIAARAGMNASQIQLIQTGDLVQPEQPTAPPAEGENSSQADQSAADAATAAGEGAAAAGDTANAGSVSSAPFTMSVLISATGTWEQLMTFVTELQNAKRALVINSFDIALQYSEAGPGGGFTLSVDATAFVVRSIGAVPIAPTAPTAEPDTTPTP